MKNIIVNDIAATNGGALTILNQFVEELKHDKGNYYYIFVSKNELREGDNYKEIQSVKNKSIFKRIIWDIFGLKKWLKKEKIKADLIISMQNIAIIGFKNIPQILYLHQPLPFYSAQYSILKKDERILWFYKNIYKFIIYYSILLTRCIVCVQSNWMREIIKNEFRKKEIDVKVIKPITEMSINNIEEDPFIQELFDNSNKFTIFYPTSNIKYKNNITAIKSVQNLNTIDKSFNQTLQLIITIENRYKIEENNIKFIGFQPKNIIYGIYKKADLLIFPSYIETFGLPLLEASTLGLPIIVSDLPYSREILNGYEGVNYIKDYMNDKAWSRSILDHYQKGKRKYKPIEWKYEGWKDLINYINDILNSTRRDKI